MQGKAKERKEDKWEAMFAKLLEKTFRRAALTPAEVKLIEKGAFALKREREMEARASDGTKRKKDD